MRDGKRSAASQSVTASWDDEGVAAIEVSGEDGRAALEAALQAVLSLVIVPADAAVEQDGERAAPIRGEGDDLTKLFADLMDDLLAQLDEFRGGLRDVSLDGVLRRDDGGFVAWGYAATAPHGTPFVALRLRQPPTVLEDAAGVTLRATLEREPGRR